eukprot:4418042-Lingulodinium_polyedra.AAC.1
MIIAQRTAAVRRQVRNRNVIGRARFNWVPFFHSFKSEVHAVVFRLEGEVNIRVIKVDVVDKVRSD